MVENQIDLNGRPCITEDQAIDILLRGGNLVDYCFQKDKFDQFSNSVETWDVDYRFNLCQDGPWENAVRERSNEWLIQSNRDIVSEILSRCPTENIVRVLDELAVFEKNGVIPLLTRLADLVDSCRKNNIVIGVGRGSSVSSYCLYLIGLHRVDSVAYGLDFNEFMT